MKIELKTGNDIKKFRKLRKCSQGKFARAIDISATWVSKLENGNKVIGDEVLIKIEQYKENLEKL